jgi:Ion transport protein
MEKTGSWSALYFIALITFGNYILLNLLVAILVESFSNEVNPQVVCLVFYHYFSFRMMFRRTLTVVRMGHRAQSYLK